MGGLGFRDIELFNLALLAKQAWRILMDGHSLSARILKAVYFANVDFLDANLGSSPSRIWRSILDGREVLEKGLIRRIGSGESTHIWNMNWIPGLSNLHPIRMVLTDPPLLVSELMDHTTASWDVQKLHAVFCPSDVEAIQKIPLCTRRQEDFWAWHHEKRGVFSVRSAYRMLVVNKDRATAYLENVAGRSDLRCEENEWKSLWQVKVPTKVHVFLWRLAQHSLSSGDVLHHRNMATRSTCSICGLPDSWKHSLIECNMAKCVWALEPEEITQLLSEIKEIEPRGWLAAIFSLLKHEDLTRMVVTLWAIWYARRKAIHDNSFQSPLTSNYSFFCEQFYS
jgi:hypothetical protein